MAGIITYMFSWAYLYIIGDPPVTQPMNGGFHEYIGFYNMFF